MNRAYATSTVAFPQQGLPREPVHIHALRDGIDAKFWPWPEVVPAYKDGFNARVLRELTEIIEERRDEIGRAWDEFFGEG